MATSKTIAALQCLDHMIVFGETQLRRILAKYAAYYNETRIHRSLDKDSRSIGRLSASALSHHRGGLHHQYCRV